MDDNNGNTNPKRRESNDETTSLWPQSLAHYVKQLGTALGQEVSPERVALYLEALRGLSENQIEYGFTIALKQFKPEFGKTFPYPGELREWAEAWRPDEHVVTRRFQNVSDIDPDRCPKGWTPEDVFRAHLTQDKIREDAKRKLPAPDRPAGEPGGWEPLLETIPSPLLDAAHKSKITKEEIAQWLEEGKAKQRAHIAQLAKDPRWQEERRLAGGPAMSAEQLAAERNGKTEVPADPIERQAWAHRKAIAQGWIAQREPGDEL